MPATSAAPELRAGPEFGQVPSFRGRTGTDKRRKAEADREELYAQQDFLIYEYMLLALISQLRIHHSNVD